MNSRTTHSKAVALVTSALAVLICLDAAGKYLGQAGVPVAVSAWARYVGHALVAIAFFLPKEGWSLFRAERPKLQWIRGLLMVAVTLLYFAALKQMPLAESTALFFLTPILTTAFAAWFLQERPSRWTLIATLLGFCGVLIVVRPGTNLVWAGVGLVIAAAFCNAGYQTLTRAASRERSSGSSETAGTQLLYAGLVGAIVLTALMPFWGSTAWFSVLNTKIFLVLLATGVLGAVGHYLLIRAYSLEPAGSLALWMYLQLVWSVGLGWLIFGQRPDGVTLIGMAVIGLAPQLARWRERRE